MPNSTYARTVCARNANVDNGIDDYRPFDFFLIFYLIWVGERRKEGKGRGKRERQLRD